jgi:membrane protease YdiL (CAAX protease family)
MTARETPEPPASPLRRLLNSRAGALLQLALVAAWAVALPGYPVLLPIFMAASAGALLWLLGDSLRDVGFGQPRGPWAQWALEALLLGAAWQALTFGLLLPFLTAWLEVEPAGGPAGAGAEGTVAALVIYAVAHPLAEGLVFRGFVLHRLEQLFGPGPASAALASALGAVLFGLAHWPQGPAGMLAGVALGGVLNWQRAWRGSAWPTLLTHAIYNGLALGLALQ